MRLFVTRHGETEFNRQERILGVTDIPLNDTGIRQARELAERIRSLGGADIIISSPYLRTKMTSEPVAELCGAVTETEYRLREWDCGSYEGKDRFTGGYQEGKRIFAKRLGGGESLLQLAHRVYSALDDIIDRYKGTDKTVLLVTHGGVCRVIETYFNDMTNEEYAGWFMGNCELREYFPGSDGGGLYDNRS
ncbi:MAG: histidine phosphatase family protein [Ruminococcus sp.]|nr:histidine phosphatase family protein [Ruminococcus sp.]